MAASYPSGRWPAGPTSAPLGVVARLRLVRQRARRWQPLEFFPALDIPPGQRQGMRMFWLDGVFASICEAFITPYLTVYLLALGANAQQVGLFAAAAGLATALAYLPGAYLADRLPNYRSMVVVSSLAYRGLLLILLALPWLIHGQALITAVIVLSALRSGFSVLSYPAWAALCAAIVPESVRGRYFSARTLAMSLAALVTIPLAGRLISSIPVPLGYQISFGLALVAGLISSWCYAQIPLLPVAKPARRQGFPVWSALKSIPQRPDFARFCVIALTLNLGLQIAAPFFNVYMVRNLGATAGFVGLATMASTAADVLGNRTFGPLLDRRGTRWVMLHTLPLLAILPLPWLLIRQPWQILPINVAGGFLWAGYNLAIFNLLLLSTPADERPLYSALINTGIASTALVGPLIGGALYAHWGFGPVIVVTSLARIITSGLIFLLIRDVRKRPACAARASANG